MGCVDIAWNPHYKSIPGRVQPCLVCEQRRRVIRRRIILAGLRVLALVNREELLRHRGVFGIDPLALVFVSVLNLKTFFEAESVIQRGTEITHLPVVAQSVDMVAAHFEKALVKAILAEIQRRT